jgi:hypothetical protein
MNDPDDPKGAEVLRRARRAIAETDQQSTRVRDRGDQAMNSMGDDGRTDDILARARRQLEEIKARLAQEAKPQRTNGEDLGPEALQHAKPAKPARYAGPVTLQDFWAYLPKHEYLLAPIGELWPAASVNGRLPKVKTDEGKEVSPAAWLDKHRAVLQATWAPGEAMIIEDKLMHVSGWVAHEGAQVFNLYRPGPVLAGDRNEAQPWLNHLKRIYPDDAEHIVRWLAHRLQHPGEKVNHALVLGGEQGIGKDTILEAVRVGIGTWNFADISPQQMMGRFNGWVRSIIVRVNEARDLGSERDRFAFYDHSKVFTAAPPDVVLCDEKNLREHRVPNVAGVIITTNHKTDGIYLPADDRRHYVAWSETQREEFGADYFARLYAWYAAGGIGHVVAYLRAFDLAGFDAKAPPPKTAAFWAIVAVGEAPESGELCDVIEALGEPLTVTLGQLIQAARELRLDGLAQELDDRTKRRTVPHKMERVGYVAVHNPDAKDGQFKVAGKRQTVYAPRTLGYADQVRAARQAR